MCYSHEGTAMERNRNSHYPKIKVFQGDIFLWMYFIPHCFLCRPSNSSVSEDAGIEKWKSVSTHSRVVQPQQDLPYITNPDPGQSLSSLTRVIHPLSPTSASWAYSFFLIFAFPLLLFIPSSIFLYSRGSTLSPLSKGLVTIIFG
jgi:hypothetical protein